VASTIIRSSRVIFTDPPVAVVGMTEQEGYRRLLLVQHPADRLWRVPGPFGTHGHYQMWQMHEPTRSSAVASGRDSAGESSRGAMRCASMPHCGIHDLGMSTLAWPKP